jgi:hypothetical protein
MYLKLLSIVINYSSVLFLFYFAYTTAIATVLPRKRHKIQSTGFIISDNTGRYLLSHPFTLIVYQNISFYKTFRTSLINVLKNIN